MLMSEKNLKSIRTIIMSSIKSKGNKSTELKTIELFKKYDIKGWRRNSQLYGKPDFVFFKSKIAIFVDGCFWHGHNCRNLSPKSNREYWQSKIGINKARDLKVTRILNEYGWKVIRIWECEVNNFQVAENFLMNLKKQLKAK